VICASVPTVGMWWVEWVPTTAGQCAHAAHGRLQGECGAMKQAHFVGMLPQKCVQGSIRDWSRMQALVGTMSRGRLFYPMLSKALLVCFAWQAPVRLGPKERLYGGGRRLQ
jgi:hypothetical protein